MFGSTRMLFICKISVTKAFSMLGKELAQILNVALRPIGKGIGSLLIALGIALITIVW